MAKHQKITATEARFPLANLSLSPMNPRQSVPDAEVQELAQSIWTAGLIQSIAGIADGKGGAEIVAGGRRLRALQYLAAQHDDLATTHPELANPLVMLAPDQATAQTWGNLENVARRDLHPADEIRAFGKMAETGAQPAAIARAFAVTEKHVYRRLALAKLPTPIIDALAANEINMSHAAAFTICEDEALALDVLDRCRGEAWSDHKLKTALRPENVKASDRRVVFVGLDAYTKAGGAIVSDLFAEDTYLNDIALLDRLFAEKLEQIAEEAEAEGWKWVEAMPNVTNYGWWDIEQSKGIKLRQEAGTLTEEQAERHDELADLAEAEALDDQGAAELAALAQIIEGDFTEAQKSVSGKIIYISSNGTLSFYDGVVRADDRAAAQEAGVIAGNMAPTDKPKSPISNALADDLRRAATGARQHAALRNPELLLSLLAYQLTGKLRYSSAFGLMEQEVANMPTTEAEGYALDARLTTPYEGMKTWCGEDFANGFEEFRARGQEQVMADLYRHLASLLKGGDKSLAELIDIEVGTNPREVWTPTAANLWNRVPGSYRQQIWRDMLDLAEDHPTATTFVKLKKAEQSERLQQLFGDEAFRGAMGVTDAQAQKIANWLPEGMA